MTARLISVALIAVVVPLGACSTDDPAQNKTSCPSARCSDHNLRDMPAGGCARNCDVEDLPNGCPSIPCCEMVGHGACTSDSVVHDASVDVAHADAMTDGSIDADANVD